MPPTFEIRKRVLDSMLPDSKLSQDEYMQRFAVLMAGQGGAGAGTEEPMMTDGETANRKRPAEHSPHGAEVVMAEPPDGDAQAQAAQPTETIQPAKKAACTKAKFQTNSGGEIVPGCKQLGEVVKKPPPPAAIDQKRKAHVLKQVRNANGRPPSTHKQGGRATDVSLEALQDTGNARRGSLAS